MLKHKNAGQPGPSVDREDHAATEASRYDKAIKGEHMLPEKQKSAYEQFYESTAKNELLDPKTTVMIQLAASFVIGCYP
jgi:hypothetical protein